MHGGTSEIGSLPGKYVSSGGPSALREVLAKYMSFVEVKRGINLIQGCVLQ